MFGAGDALFGTLTHLARLLPVLPLIGGGHTRLEPVLVEDVAEAIVRILADPATAGRTYELAGPGVYTMRELVMIVLRIIGRRRALVSVPFAVADPQARLFEFLPRPPLTTGQVDLLKADNVASGDLPGLRELNIQPRTVEAVVPTYLVSTRSHSQFARANCRTRAFLALKVARRTAAMPRDCGRIAAARELALSPTAVLPHHTPLWTVAAAACRMNAHVLWGR